MVPTFTGRLQTRLFSMVVIGLPWTLLMCLALAPAAGGLGPILRAGLFSLGATLAVGLVLWEPLYHFLMQFRWEKDWPTLFVLTESVPEAALVWLLLDRLGPGAPFGVFLTLFFSTWLVVFLVLHGPMRVVFLRWRFRGGRLG